MAVTIIGVFLVYRQQTERLSSAKEDHQVILPKSDLNKRDFTSFPVYTEDDAPQPYDNKGSIFADMQMSIVSIYT